MILPFPFLKIAHSILLDKAMMCTYNATHTGCGITLREACIHVVDRMELRVAKIRLSVNYPSPCYRLTEINMHFFLYSCFLVVLLLSFVWNPRAPATTNGRVS